LRLDLPDQLGQRCGELTQGHAAVQLVLIIVVGELFVDADALFVLAIGGVLRGRALQVPIQPRVGQRAGCAVGQRGDPGIYRRLVLLGRGAQ
jgi:hypothetical protein